MAPPPPPPTVTPRPGLVARPPLDVYKKVAIIRSTTDGISYEDVDGNIQRISDLGEAATSAAPALKPKKKSDIPVPRIVDVEEYDEDVQPTYRRPVSFVRHVRPTVEECDAAVEYNLDEEDEVWLESHPRFGPRPPSPPPSPLGVADVKSEVEPVALDASGDDATEAVAAAAAAAVATVATNEAKGHKRDPNAPGSGDESPGIEPSDKGTLDPDATADNVAKSSPPSEWKCQECGGPWDDDPDDDDSGWFRPVLSPKGMERMLDILEKATGFETIVTTGQAERLIIEKMPTLLEVFGSGAGDAPGCDKGERKRKRTGPNVRTVIHEVYNYWVQKRSKLRKPLLRRYWPVTSTNDTNPHMVFRPREKEKYKLRKKRQNDMEAFRKMKQLRKDFDQIRAMLDLVRRRERIYHCMTVMQFEWFEQRIFDLTDTSGVPRLSHRLSRDAVEQVMDVPKIFDTKELDKGKRKKRKRNSGNRSASPVPDAITAAAAAAELAIEAAEPAVSIAGENNGLPAPSFLNPLDSRQHFVTEWDNRTGVPAITSYVDSHPVPTYRFRHRPRLGRGGRIVIDRHPCPPHPDVPPVNVFAVGEGLGRSGGAVEPAGRLLELLPKPLDHARVRRRVELICAEAMSDDGQDPSDKGVTMSSSQAGGGAIDVDENDGEFLIIPEEDWLETPEPLWGEERFSLGPI